MDSRSKIRVSLPRDNPTKSYWGYPNYISDLRTTKDLPESTDIVIIGSGISGTAITWHTLHHTPDTKIVLPEAREACSGATGRNGGHIKAASYRSFLDTAETLGTDVAVQIANLKLSNLQQVNKFQDSQHAVPYPTIDVFYDEEQWKKAHRSIAAMRAASPAGHPAADYTFYTADEVREKFHCHSNIFNGKEEKLYGGVGYRTGTVSSYNICVGQDKSEEKTGREEKLKEWFPDVFRVPEERLAKKFESRVHASAGTKTTDGV